MPTMIGARVLRKEDPNLITGRGSYVDDVKLASTVHMTFVRSVEATVTRSARSRKDSVNAMACSVGTAPVGRVERLRML